MQFNDWFKGLTGHLPRTWQAELGHDARCRDRLVRVPTGFGKTAGVALTWMHHRVALNNDQWPRRLVFCLPMRVLVEQTQEALEGWVTRASLDLKVHVLMGGVEAERWLHDIDKPSVLL